MDDVASTGAEANVHIQRLREARGITGDHNDISNGVLVSSLNEALNLRVLSRNGFGIPMF